MTGNIEGKAVKDVLCLSNNMENCYSNKTEDLYEFFLIQNRSIPDGFWDGSLGLAPGQLGF
jgi:hypothetical protein